MAYEAALTERQLEVVRALSSGATTAEVAERLCISTATLRTHIKHAEGKVGVRCLHGLVAWYLHRNYAEHAARRAAQ